MCVSVCSHVRVCKRTVNTDGQAESQASVVQARYRELLLVVETCQAESLHVQLRSPNFLSIAASKVGALSCAPHSCRCHGSLSGGACTTVRQALHCVSHS